MLGRLEINVRTVRALTSSEHNSGFSQSQTSPEAALPPAQQRVKNFSMHSGRVDHNKLREAVAIFTSVRCSWKRFASCQATTRRLSTCLMRAQSSSDASTERRMVSGRVSQSQQSPQINHLSALENAGGTCHTSS